MRRPGSRVVTLGSLAIVLGTALGFGAVYPWVYWPALAACAVVSMLALWSGGRSGVREHLGLAIGLCGVGVATAMQIVPLPAAVRFALSPSAERVRRVGDLEQLALRLASAGSGAEAGPVGNMGPLSIDPVATATALVFVAVLGGLMVGLAVHFARSGGPEGLVPGVIAIGVILAVVAIVQQATFDGRIYGFWQPESRGARPFGPFVNRNHFAGWMIMAAPLGLGYLIGSLGRSTRAVRAGGHQRLRWLASPAASRLVLAGIATTVLAGAVVLTLSRSGMASLVVAVVVVGASAMRARPRRATSPSLGAAMTVGLVAVAALWWVGVDAVLQRFASLEGTTLSGRVGVWRDTVAIASDFPLVGSGLDTFATAIVSYETPGQQTLFTEAHNDYLQLASEGGLLVCVPALGTLVAFVALVRRRFREPRVSQMTWWIRVGAVAGLVAVALQSLVEFSLQIPANAVLCSVLCAIAVHREAAVAERTAAVPADDGAAVCNSLTPPLEATGS